MNTMHIRYFQIAQFTGNNNDDNNPIRRRAGPA